MMVNVKGDTEANNSAECLSVDLAIDTYKGREFIDDLERLCEKYADNNIYYLKFY